jgi:hypothetical protein
VHVSSQALLLLYALKAACTPSVAVVACLLRITTLLYTLHVFVAFVQQRAAAPAVSMRALVGRISQQGNSYLITGGTDRHIRYWDFQVTTALNVTPLKVTLLQLAENIHGNQS